jgi:hypothetical protein
LQKINKLSDGFASTLLIKDVVPPLTFEDLIKTIENNESRVMFVNRGQLVEKMLRDDSTNLFAKAVQKHAPIYATDLMDNVLGVCTVLNGPTSNGL